MHEILLSEYFREELKQRIWRRGLPQESPCRSFWVTDMHNANLRKYGGQTLSFSLDLCLQMFMPLFLLPLSVGPLACFCRGAKFATPKCPFGAWIISS